MQINVKTIPHDKQRYDTCGDWWFDEENDSLEIRVSDMKNINYEYLVADHEMRESMVCNAQGISEKQITEFDMKFEEIRKEYPAIIGSMEPGDMTSAPYCQAHKFATDVERVTAVQLKVDWKEYDDKVASL